MTRVIVEPILSPVIGPHLPFLGEVRQLAARRKVSMSITKLSRTKMCSKILAAIQKYPGCKAVKEVSIAEVADTVADSIWRVTVIDSGGVEIEKANHAARDAQKELRQHYELLTDS
jgi:hypothetical protein